MATLFLCVVLNSNAAEKDCEGLKRRLSSYSHSDRSSVLKELDVLIGKREDCAKNLLGRLYFEGKVVDQDVDKAHAIFFDLAQQGYPPAAYNLAYVAIKLKMEPPESVVSLLQGVMLKYLGDREWGYISANARDLVWDYFDDLQKEDYDRTKLNLLKKTHKFLVANSNAQFVTSIESRTREIRQDSGNIILGLMAVGATAAIATRLSTPPPTTHLWSTQSFYPRVYTVVPTGSPNVLYFLPH